VIADKFGTKVAAIKAANGLTSDLIREGQTLKVPGVTKKPSAAAPVPAPAPVVEEAPAPAPDAGLDPVEAAPAPDAGLTPAPVPAPVPAPAPDALAPAPAPAAVQTYTVKEGEDVYAVAIRWGVSPSELKALNNLATHELRPGQILKIPPVTPAP